METKAQICALFSVRAKSYILIAEHILRSTLRLILSLYIIKEGSKMTQSERRLYLIRALQSERAECAAIEIPKGEQAQSDLLRALMNVRMPRPVSPEFLKIQDEYLQTERDRRGVVDSGCLPSVPADKRLVLWQGDMTTLKADAIVNAANSQMLGCFYPLHGCIDNIVHSRSGIQLRLLCNDIMTRQGHEEPAGRAKITPAFNLPSKYILHTVGPIIHGRVTEKDSALLAGCYRSCLELAAKNGCQSVAFCCISTGEFHFPNEPAAEIAVKTVQAFLNEHDTQMRIIFNVFKDTDLAIYQKLLGVKA